MSDARKVSQSYAIYSDLVQGYYLARPMPGDVFLNWVDCYFANQAAIVDDCAESKA